MNHVPRLERAWHLGPQVNLDALSPKLSDRGQDLRRVAARILLKVRPDDEQSPHVPADPVNCLDRSPGVTASVRRAMKAWSLYQSA